MTILTASIEDTPYDQSKLDKQIDDNCGITDDIIDHGSHEHEDLNPRPIAMVNINTSESSKNGTSDRAKSVDPWYMSRVAGNKITKTHVSRALKLIMGKRQYISRGRSRKTLCCTRFTRPPKGERKT